MTCLCTGEVTYCRARSTIQRSMRSAKDEPVCGLDGVSEGKGVYYRLVPGGFKRQRLIRYARVEILQEYPIMET